MTVCVIALGGNIGDVVTTMESAIDRLDADSAIHVTQPSRVYETAPVGVVSGGLFLNATARLETSLPPHDLLDKLKQVERQLGRMPGKRWTERVIDLDLLLLGDEILKDEQLTLPHPHLWWRRFVLDPLVDVAADLKHPVFHVTFQQLRDSLLSRPLPVVVSGGCPEERLAVGSVLTRRGLTVDRSLSVSEGSLRVSFADVETRASGQRCEPVQRWIELASIPGGQVEAAEGIATAVLDEPQVHSRPLRRMP